MVDKGALRLFRRSGFGDGGTDPNLGTSIASAGGGGGGALWDSQALSTTTGTLQVPPVRTFLGRPLLPG